MEQQESKQQEPKKLTEYPFEFRGNGGEFFKIWIVNILLTVATLGIYSAWAKVRTLRYFYGNTFLNERSFEYLANPLAILKGRIIAVVLFLLYGFLSGAYPIAGAVMLLLFFLLSPLIVVRALRFQFRMSAFQNIRFNFVGSYLEAAKIYIGWSILSVLTLGILYPVLHQRFVKYFVSNTRYGDEKFENHSPLGKFYNIYIILFVVAFVMFTAAGIAGVAFSGLAQVSNGGQVDPETAKAAMIPMLVAVYGVMLLFYLIVFAVMKSTIVNLIMNYTSIEDDSYFDSDLKFGGMLWILSVNLVAIIFTFGLAYPWAKVRLARYRAEHTRLNASRSIDSIVSSQKIEKTGAFGEEMGEVFDMDISI